MSISCLVSSSSRGTIALDAYDDHLILPIVSSLPAIELYLTHQHISFTFTTLSSVDSFNELSCRVLSVCRRGVLAPINIHLCSLLNMFDPSHSQPLLYTQKISTIETTSISIPSYICIHISIKLPLFVLPLCMNLLSVHVPPIC